MPQNTITFPPFCLDLPDEALWKGSVKLRLRPKSFAVLRYLVTHAGRLVLRAELLAAVWPETTRQSAEPRLKGCIREIRVVLSDNPKDPRFIETVHCRGHRFVSPLTAAEDPGAAPTNSATEEPALASKSRSPISTPRPRSPASSSGLPRQPGDSYHLEWYVDREEEQNQTLERLRQTRAPVVLHGPPSSGVATLLSHILHRCSQPIDPKHSGARVVRLKFSRLAAGEIPTFANFLHQLGQEIASQLGLGGPGQWQGLDSPGSELTQFLEQAVLPQVTFLILAIEKLDDLQGRPYLDDFCMLLRSWVQRTTRDWPRLRILLTLSTHPSMLEALDRSPLMNVAKTIEIKGLTASQLGNLAELYELHPAEEDINALLQLTGGHAYLAHLAFFESAMQHKPIEKILETSLHEGGIYEHWLLWQRSWLHSNKLLKLVCAIAREARVEVDYPSYCKLYGRGLIVKNRDGEPCLRYRLYKDYFGKFRGDR